jgi:hypothetical protein
MPEKPGIFICKGINIKRLHTRKKSVRKIGLEHQVFMSEAGIGKTCIEIISLGKGIISLETVNTRCRDFIDIPGSKSVGIMIIINDSAGIMDLEEGVEFVGQQGRGEEEKKNDWENG